MKHFTEKEIEELAGHEDLRRRLAEFLAEEERPEPNSQKTRHKRIFGMIGKKERPVK